MSRASIRQQLRAMSTASSPKPLVAPDDLFRWWMQKDEEQAPVPKVALRVDIATGEIMENNLREVLGYDYGPGLPAATFR